MLWFDGVNFGAFTASTSISGSSVLCQGVSVAATSASDFSFFSDVTYFDLFYFSFLMHFEYIGDSYFYAFVSFVCVAPFLFFNDCAIGGVVDMVNYSTDI